MPQISMTSADLGDLAAVDVDDLYADLAIAEAGSEVHIDDALRSVASVRAMVAAESASLGGLARKGKQIFNRYWPAVKTIVCKLYDEKGEDWISAAATAIAAFLSVGGAIAALILKIALKLGMELICDADASPQPA